MRNVYYSHFFFILAVLGMEGVNAQDLVPGAWPHLKGYWKFQNINQLSKATVGKDLTLTGTHQAVAGPAVGDTSIRISIGSYYTCQHGMAPNGGGDSVNQYTLMFDFKVLSFKKWHTFFKTDSNNNNDGECFIRPLSGSNPGRIGVAATGYSKDSINPNQWYRLIISVNLGHYYRYYLNGVLLHEGDTQEVDGRFALTPKMIFFGDDNQEDDTIDVASVAVFDTCLSAIDIAGIGSIDPCVVNPPKINLGRDTSLCDYNTIVKNAGAGFKKYQWSTGASQSSLTITKSIGLGTKKIWCKITDVNGCVAADTFALTYFPSPVVNLGSDQAFCEGYTTKLVAGADTSFQYLWKYLPQGNVLSNNNQIFTDSTGYYSVTVTTKAGCYNRDTIHVNVYKKPAKPVITITGKTDLCAGESVSLSGPGGYFDYAWSNGAGTQTIGSNKNDTIKLRVTDYNNCTSPYSDSIVIRVFSLPPKPKLTLTGNAVFCFGDSALLAAPSGYNSYIWNDGPGFANRTFKNAGAYYVKVKGVNDCISMNSDTVVLKVNPKPAPPAITVSGKNDICDGEKVILSAPAGFAKYAWTNNISTQFDTISVSGTYSVSVENSFGCKSDSGTGVTIAVHPLPAKPTVVVTGKDSLGCSVAAGRYRWFRNGVLLQDTTKDIINAPSGYYRVQAGNNWCWSALSDSFFNRHSGFATIRMGTEAFNIYPNPATSTVFIKLNEQMEFAEASLELINLEGRMVYKTGAGYESLLKGIFIDMRELSTGIYHLRIVLPDKILIAKVEKL